MPKTKNKKLYQKTWFNMSILFTVAIIVGGFFYYKFFVPFEDVGFVLGSEVERVIIKSEINKNGDKIFTDKSTGIKIKGENDWVVLYSENNSFSLGPENTLEGKSDEGVEVNIYPSTKNKSLKSWVNDWVISSNCPSCYKEPEFINDYVRIEDSGSLGEIIHFFIYRREKIYQLTTFNSENNLEIILKRITF